MVHSHVINVVLVFGYPEAHKKALFHTAVAVTAEMEQGIATSFHCY